MRWLKYEFRMTPGTSQPSEQYPLHLQQPHNNNSSSTTTWQLIWHFAVKWGRAGNEMRPHKSPNSWQCRLSCSWLSVGSSILSRRRYCSFALNSFLCHVCNNMIPLPLHILFSECHLPCVWPEPIPVSPDLPWAPGPLWSPGPECSQPPAHGYWHRGLSWGQHHCRCLHFKIILENKWWSTRHRSAG